MRKSDFIYDFEFFLSKRRKIQIFCDETTKIIKSIKQSNRERFNRYVQRNLHDENKNRSRKFNLIKITFHQH